MLAFHLGFLTLAIAHYLLTDYQTRYRRSQYKWFMVALTSLFPVEEQLPRGFSYIEAFLSIQEEQALLDKISLVDLHQMVFHGYMAMRKVKSFGYDYHFDSRTLTEGLPIPENFTALLESSGAT